MVRHTGTIVTAVFFCLMLAACGGGNQDADVRARYQPVDLENADTIGVNGYLWRATLDTLAFLPLKSSDSTGGVIITDWYVNPDVPNERFSLSVYIMDKVLRADALNVHVHRQVYDDRRGWMDASAQEGTAQKLEEAILARARELRLGMVTR